MEDLYRINDVLTDLAAEFGVDTSTDESADKLDELTHAFAKAFGVHPEHVAQDRDHEPIGQSEYGDEIPDTCKRCGLAVTPDGKRHGFAE